jgi:hypothetical protein
MVIAAEGYRVPIRNLRSHPFAASMIDMRCLDLAGALTAFR